MSDILEEVDMEKVNKIAMNTNRFLLVFESVLGTYCLVSAVKELIVGDEMGSGLYAASAGICGYDAYKRLQKDKNLRGVATP